MGQLKMTDVVVGAVLITAVGGVVIGATAKQIEIRNRVRCASNLKQLGQAILLYSNENRNAYPRTTVQMDGPPVWGTPYADDADAAAVANQKANPFASEKIDEKEVVALRPAANDVTAALFLLLRTQDLVPEVFVCPSSRAKKFDYGGEGASALSFTNFPGKAALSRSLSYSYQNPYASKAAVGAGFKLNNSITAEFAVMADMNPGGEALLTLKADAPAEELRKGNSVNHTFNGVRDGQNILFGDGHVEFTQSPFVGVWRDNIYVANDGPNHPNAVKRNGDPAIVASPADANDSILLPTATDIGQWPLPEVKPAPDGAESGKAFAGTYTGTIAGAKASMTIKDDVIYVASGMNVAKYPFTVAGMRGESLVLNLKGDGLPEGTQADFTVIGSSLYIDSSEPTGLLQGDGGGGNGWTLAK